VGAVASLVGNWPEAASLIAVPAILMVVVVLCAWRMALLPGVAVVATVLLHRHASPGWFALLAVVAVICGEALRRGLPPVLAWPLLAAPMVALSRGGVVESAAMAALAIVPAASMLLYVPRRPLSLAPRCRGRWDHHVFVGLAGTSSAVALSQLAGLPPAVVGASPLRSMVLVASIGMVAWLVSLACRRATRLFAQDGVRAAWPLEVLQARAFIRRRAGRQRHEAARSKRQLQDLRRLALRLQDQLKRAEAGAHQGSQHRDEAAGDRDDIQARYRALLEGDSEAVMFIDAGVITALSRATSTVLGFPPGELLGKPVGLLIPHDHVTPHPFDEADAGHSGADGETVEGPVRLASGKQRQFRISIQRFRSGGTVHRLVRLQDARPMQRALATLEEVQRMNRQADQARDVFVATMSHELRTPLHGLIATLDMLRTGGDSTEAFQHQLSIARSSARALLKIANDVLDVTRIKSNLFTLERRRFSMNAMLREVVEEASARAASLGLSMSSEVVDALPPSFIGDPGRLKQILGNLVSNALKFTASGGVTLRVRYDGRRCIVDVQDTGPGIPADKRNSIFEPFVQLESTARRQAGGAGLGLTISRRLAEAMKGELTLHDSGPRGSTFRLSLPLEASDEAPPEDDSQRIFTNPRGRILVVEDNPANRYVAEALLAGMDCPATIVEGGEQALRLLQEQDFDLILMDCQMPGMDGYETTRRIRGMLDRRVPIIAMTANAMADDRNHCLAAGMDDFLPKPFNRAELNTVLCKWLAPGSASDAEPTPLDARIGMHPDLDVGVFDELRESLKWKNEPLERICAAFTASVERALPLLDAPDADRKALGRNLHTVMGSAGMVGARQVEFLAGQMQRALNDNRAGALDGAAAMLERATRRYERAVNRRVNMVPEHSREAGRDG
jgi:signal transduction histidine kinase/CheY-like chemotaxis protein